MAYFFSNLFYFFVNLSAHEPFDSLLTISGTQLVSSSEYPDLVGPFQVEAKPPGSVSPIQGFDFLSPEVIPPDLASHFLYEGAKPKESS